MRGRLDQSGDDERRDGSERRRRVGSTRGQQQGRVGRDCVSQSRYGVRLESVGWVVSWIGPLSADDELLIHP
jgi:hypothetical protein